MSDQDALDGDRRNFLVTATCCMGAVGVAAAAWPFINSMNPTAAVRGKPVFVFHRTPEQVAAMAHSSGGKDPQPDSARVKQPEWLVVVGICTHLGCVPNKSEEGWLCPCHGSAYDNSGRILHGPAPRNLDVPPYNFAGADKIVVG